ncbi:hypothetical protein [Haloarcula onubensis]|uniref:Phosphatidate cytidylyltransferase n=1 Tax=Haloarcula onubensis TaxID=2950539 RepID=A0ABU2FPZ5_9EURY|nr:hypothetical protein [Halomicroarcula sp. S3CR25-11]MDS0282826.1 hypothetical protein [Halomicroarcula sp. S3CR25-11]
METAIRTGTMQVTVLCLVAAGSLLALGVAGVPASPALVVVLLALSAGLYFTRPDADAGHVLGIDVGSLLSALWLAPALAALAVLVEPSASAEELQALGGLVGLAGMANYFLRPVYLLAYSLVEAVQQRGRKSADR